MVLQREHAAVAIGRIVCESATPVRLVTLGPLTNIATAVRLTPKMAANIESVVVMGGCYHAVGNV